MKKSPLNTDIKKTHSRLSRFIFLNNFQHPLIIRQGNERLPLRCVDEKFIFYYLYVYVFDKQYSEFNLMSYEEVSGFYLLKPSG